MKTKKVYILGNGSQAPYGIGEIIDIIPMAHWRKIKKICNYYYKSPTLRLNSTTGNLVDWDYDGCQIVGLVDLGRKNY